jgi:NAD(P)H dehydrogenase (quinone)
MRVLVLYAHPHEESFCAALHAAVLEGLAEAGHTVDDLDLYAEDFDPVLSRHERLAYHDVPDNRAPVAGHVERLLAAEALVVVAPIWNFGFPAILKGYFDRVFLPGVSLHLKHDGGVAPGLGNIRKLVTVTTYGGGRMRAMLAGDPPRKFMTRVMRATIRPFASVVYLALYGMNTADRATRKAFLERVRERMRRL